MPFEVIAWRMYRDSNGAQLFDGDTLILAKSLDVKGSTGKCQGGNRSRGIKNQQIVILT